MKWSKFPVVPLPLPAKWGNLSDITWGHLEINFFSVFDPAVTIKMWVQKSLVTVMLSLWLSFLAILVQISGKVPCAWKWHKATWNQLICFDSLLLTSSQLSDKVKGFFWKCELWFSQQHGVQQPGVKPSPQSQGAECRGLMCGPLPGACELHLYVPVLPHRFPVSCLCGWELWGAPVSPSCFLRKHKNCVLCGEGHQSRSWWVHPNFGSSFKQVIDFRLAKARQI